MAPKMINVLLTTFSGLSLPATLSIPISSSAPIKDFYTKLLCYLPELKSRLILTTTANREIQPLSSAPITSLLSCDTDAFLPIRLSVPLCGGKGGFGSQLRAAGGRMSSRRKKNQGEANSSNRNLDGRRLRTITEAKALAEYLALKPDMDKKVKEARRKRWEQVANLAEKREEEIRNGSKGRVDGRWVEDKEEVGERTREAVFAAMKTGGYQDNLMRISGGSSGGGSDQTSDENEDENLDKHNHGTSARRSAKNNFTQSYFGFDDDGDDEYMSDESTEGQDNNGNSSKVVATQ